MQDELLRSAKIPPGALPRDAAAQRDWLRLARSRRVGPATFVRLVRAHGSATAALAALPRVAAEAGVPAYAAYPREAAEAELAAAEAAGARPLFLGAPDYPALLALIADPPPLLWVRGTPGADARPAFRRPVALVGARNASALGTRMAARLGRELGAAGHAVASGLARGIDAAAHDAALATGTIAVLAGGVDIVYPPQNAGLAERIAASGLLLSEMAMGTPPRAAHFLRRNRLVAGLSLAVVVVEAAERSGALNTARNALEQGREVMAVPGHPLDPRAGGCNQLIRDGALLVRSAADVAEALAGILAEPAAGPPAGPPGEPRAAATPGPAAAAQAPAVRPEPAARGDLAPRLLSLLGPVPVAEDALIREAGAPAAAVAAALLELELAGRVARHPGGLVSRPAA